MYLESLYISRLKLLEDFWLSFTNEDGSIRKWTVIIGKNGTAKTSILQAIALAAAGKLQINALAKPVVGHLRDRREDAFMRVRANFRVPGQSSDPAYLHSTVELAPGSNTLEADAYLGTNLERELDPLVDARKTNRPGWFVAGYGVSRFLPDPTRNPTLENPSIERMEPLFQHTAGLTSLRFVDYFPPAHARSFVKVLRDMLTNVHDLVPDLETIELKGQGGVTTAGQLIDRDRFALKTGSKELKLPAVALSHGYQSVIAWIADLIGHMMLELGPNISARDMRGVVLIDEIDLYLHPSWQAGLIPALRETFPEVQFIATTHSPVVLAGLAPHEIVRVAQHPETGSVYRWGHDAETGELVQVGPDTKILEPDPRTMTGTELYRSWFDVDRLLLNPKGHVLREWRRIAGDPFRTDEEEASLRSLREELEGAGIAATPDPVAREMP